LGEFLAVAGGLVRAYASASMVTRWLLIGWQVFWLAVFVPGHTRGAITLPGEPSARCYLDSSPAGGCCSSAKSDGQEPTPDDRRRCAVCFLVKGYINPVIDTFELTLTERLIEATLMWRAQVRLVAFDFPYYPSGPPA
jgi:hypothetical protein